MNSTMNYYELKNQTHGELKNPNVSGMYLKL